MHIDFKSAFVCFAENKILCAVLYGDVLYATVFKCIERVNCVRKATSKRFRRFVPSVGFLKKWKERKNARYCLMDSGYDRVMNPPYLSGCFMFMRLSTISGHGIFFDDRFFMYFEDFDLIRRLHRVGKTVFLPDAEIVHDHAAESYKSRKMLAAHIQSAIRYFNKWGWLFDRERRAWNRQILESIAFKAK